MAQRESKRARLHQNKPTPTSQEAIAGEDRISSLPDVIIHHILSFLPIKNVARMSVSSKRWEFLWVTYPIIELDEEWIKAVGLVMRRKKFRDCLRASLACRNMRHLQKLKIRTQTIRCDFELNLLVDRFVDLAIRGKVQHLDLNFASEPITHLYKEKCDICYVLPEIIFSSGLSLGCLMVKGCQFEDYNVVNFPFLTELFMEDIHITDQMFKRMIYCSPLLENLSLQECHGLEKLKIFSHKLRCLVISHCREIKEFNFYAPNLQSFKYEGYHYINNEGLATQELHEFRSITFCYLHTLYLSRLHMKDSVLHQMLSNYPNLEIMELKSCLISNRVQVSCEKLKKFVVDDCDFEEFEISAPELEHFMHSCFVGASKLRRFGIMKLRNLVTLSLGGILFATDEFLQSLISNCPLLETLYLVRCIWLKRMKIFSQSLNVLKVNDCQNLEDMEIVAPKLQYFTYTGFTLEFCSLIASDLLETELHLLELNHYDLIYHCQPIEVRRFLQKFGNSRSMKLVSKCAVCAIIPEDLNEEEDLCMSLPPYHWRHLKVMFNSLIETDYIFLLSGVLRYSSCLNTLLIKLESSSVQLQFEDFQQIERTNSPNSQSTAQDCVSQHLVGVGMEGFEGSGMELRLVKFLLLKAESLKIMSISIKEETRMHRSNIMEEINKYFKASIASEIVFS